jgi:hypothetical protein
MTFKIDPILQRFIEKQVKAGCFNTPTEVVEAGLARLMLDPEPEPLSEPAKSFILTFEEITLAIHHDSCLTARCDQGRVVGSRATCILFSFQPSWFFEVV